MQNVIDFILDHDAEELWEYYQKKNKEFIDTGYKKYVRTYVQYFRERKDYKRIIWNLFIKAIREKPFIKVFERKMRAAMYTESGVWIDFEAFDNKSAIKVLKENAKKLSEIPWADDKSIRVLDTILEYRITGDKTVLFNEIDILSKQYIDDDIVKLQDGKEVFVDAGGYIGDTVQQLTKKIKSWKKIFLFEVSKENMGKAKENLKDLKNIEFYQMGLGECETSAILSGVDQNGHIQNEKDTDQDGSELVKITTLDSVVHDKVTYIKMDIEGSELMALKGSCQQISLNLPKLAISIYHKYTDLWEVPRYIMSITGQYDFYLRHYGNTFTELILYCIPKDRANK